MRRLSLVMMVLVVAALPAGATTMLSLSIEELVASSDAVAIVRVTSVETLRAGGRLTTHVELEVEEGLLGAKRGDGLVVHVPGGEANGIVQYVAGAPRPEEGDRVLVFLESKGGGYYRLTGLSQGWLPITNDPDDPTREQVVRTIDAELVRRGQDGGLEPAPALPSVEPLRPLLDRIRRSVEPRP